MGSRGNSVLQAQEEETSGWQPSCHPVSIWTSLTPCKTLRIHQNTWWKSKGIKKHKCDSQFNWDALSESQGREVPAQFLRVPVQQGLPAVRGAQLQHCKSCHSCVQRPLVRAVPRKEQLYTVNGCADATSQAALDPGLCTANTFLFWWKSEITVIALGDEKIVSSKWPCFMKGCFKKTNPYISGCWEFFFCKLTLRLIAWSKWGLYISSYLFFKNWSPTPCIIFGLCCGVLHLPQTCCMYLSGKNTATPVVQI